VFLGHFALAFASKRVEPEIGLGESFLAAQFCDCLWPVLLLAKVERVSIVPGDTAVTPLRFDAYPISHSLLTVAVFGAVFAAAHLLATGRRRAAGLLGLLVVSHWVLDALSHRPDMPLFPWGGPKVGLGLWNSVPATILTEGALFVLGVALYVSATRARDRVGGWGLAALVALLAVSYALNLLGPPPPSVLAIALAGLVGFLVFIVFGAVVDRHRSVA